MFSKAALSFLFIGIVTYTQAQTIETDSLMNDSLYQKAVQMTNELNSSKTNFAEKEKVPGFLVSNASKSAEIQSTFPGSTAQSANPHNASDPLSAIVLGAYNSLFNIKKKK